MVGAALFWEALAVSEMRAVDLGLAAQARVIIAGLREGPQGLTYRGQLQLPDTTPQGTAIPAIVVSGGRVVLSSPDQLSPAPEPSDAGAFPPDQPVTTGSGDSESRVLVREAIVDGRDVGTVVLLRALQGYDESRQLSALYLAITVVLLVTAASVVSYGLAGRALKPVREISALARRLSGRDLSSRIDLPLPHDELGQLASTFNEMLGRLQNSFESMQRFTADAAHELRTPLAVMRTHIEVALRGPANDDDYRAALTASLDEVTAMTTLADQLLLLARGDARALTLNRVKVDPTDLVEESAARWRTAAARRRVKLRAVPPHDPAIVTADATLLRRLLDNLVDNAIRYAGRGATVSVGASVGTDAWELAVADTGRGVDPALRETIFLPFRRGDRARSRSGAGAGLGLAICSAIAAAHDGRIAYEDVRPRGARFVVSLPLR